MQRAMQKVTWEQIEKCECQGKPHLANQPRLAAFRSNVLCNAA